MCYLLTERTFIHKIEYKYCLKSELEIYLHLLLTDVIKEREDLLCKVQKNAENLNSKIGRLKNGRLIMQPKCAECGGLLSSVQVLKHN